MSVVARLAREIYMQLFSLRLFTSDNIHG